MQQVTSFKDVLASLRSTATELLRETQGATDGEARGVAASNMSNAVLLLADVKAANRELTLSVEDLRGKVQSASAAADAHDLSLQNLLYEKHHLLREIRKCKELATPEFDKINFVAVDDMVQANPALASSDDHALTLNRLQHELQARKELEAQLEAVKQRVVAQQELNKGKTTYLQTLPVQLKALESAAAPFVSRLGLPSSAAATRHARTLGLPGPLYTAYSQLEALLDLASQPVPFGSDGGGSRASAAAKWMAVDVCAAVAPALDGTLPTSAISVPADRLSGLQGTGITVTRLEGQAGAGAAPAASSSSSSGAAAVAVGGGARKRKRADSSSAADGGAGDDDDADVGTEPEEGVAAASHSTGSSDIGILSPVKMAVVATADCFKPHPKAVLIAYTLGEGGVCCGIRLQYYPLLDVVTAAAAVEPSELATAAAVVSMLQGSAAKPTASAPSAAAAAASGPASSSTTSAAAVTSSAATSSTPLTLVSVPANVLAHLLGSGDDGSTHPRWTQALVASGVPSVAATGGTGVPRVPLSTSSSSSSQPGGLPYHWLDALSGCSSAAASVPPQGYSGPPPSSVSVASLIASLRTRLFVSAQVARQVGVLVKAPSQLYSQLVQPELKTINGAAHCASVSNKLLSLHKSSTAELLKIGGAALADAQAVMPVIASMMQLLGERLSTATPVPAPATLVSLQQLTGRAAVAAEGIIGGHASSSAASGTADAVDTCQYLQATYTLTASKGPKATGGSYSTSNVQLTVVAFIRLPLSFPSSSPSAPGTAAGAGVAAPAAHLLVSGINAIGNKPVMLVNVPASAAAAGNMTNSLLTGIDVSVGQVPATAADAGGGGAAVGLARLASLLTASTSLLCPSPPSLLHALPHLLFVLGHILPASLARPAKLDLSSEAAAASLTGLASPLPPIHHMYMAASGGGTGWAPGGHVKLAAVTGEDGTGIQLQWRA